MAKPLDQVMADLDPYYSGSKGIIQNQLNALPGETEAAIGQADAKLAQANDSILAGARRRGIGFGGIPIGEQAQYAATDYAPAIANLKSSQNNKQISLMEALNGLGRDQRTAAQGIYDAGLNRDFQERQFQEQIRQFNEAQAAAAREAAASRAAAAAQQANIGAYLGGGSSGGSGGASNGASMVRNDKGYQFTSANGRPITAAAFAQSKGIGVRQLLSDMAKNGDVNAKAMLPFVNDAGKFQNVDKRFAGAAGALGLSGSYSQNVSGKDSLGVKF